MQWISRGATAFQCRVTVKPQGILLFSILHSPSGRRAARTKPDHTLWVAGSNTNCSLLGSSWLRALGTLHSSGGCSSGGCAPATPTKHHRDGPTHPLCGSCFSFPANWTFSMRSWPLSELLQSLVPENLKDWAKLSNEDGSQPLSSSGEGSGQVDAKGNPAPLQGSKKHHYSPHSSWWRLNFFDLVITNRDDSKVNQSNQTNPTALQSTCSPPLQCQLYRR